MTQDQHPSRTPERIELPGGFWSDGEIDDREMMDVFEPASWGAQPIYAGELSIEAARAFASALQPQPRGVERMFPIMKGPKIPWRLIEPFEYQAKENHGQSLERLAARGGLDMGEAMAVMTGKKWNEIKQPSLDEFLAFIQKREALLSSPASPDPFRDFATTADEAAKAASPDKQICPECKGRGRCHVTDGNGIRAIDCSRCDGTGSVPASPDTAPRDQGGLAERVQRLLGGKLKAKAVKGDDGVWFICHAGDTICLGDPNHTDPDDEERFKTIADALNWLAALHPAPGGHR